MYGLNSIGRQKLKLRLNLKTNISKNSSLKMSEATSSHSVQRTTNTPKDHMVAIKTIKSSSLVYFPMFSNFDPSLQSRFNV